MTGDGERLFEILIDRLSVSIHIPATSSEHAREKLAAGDWGEDEIHKIIRMDGVTDGDTLPLPEVEAEELREAIKDKEAARA